MPVIIGKHTQRGKKKDCQNRIRDFVPELLVDPTHAKHLMHRDQTTRERSGGPVAVGHHPRKMAYDHHDWLAAAKDPH